MKLAEMLLLERGVTCLHHYDRVLSVVNDLSKYFHNNWSLPFTKQRQEAISCILARTEDKTGPILLIFLKRRFLKLVYGLSSWSLHSFDGKLILVATRHLFYSLFVLQMAHRSVGIFTHALSTIPKQRTVYRSSVQPPNVAPIVERLLIRFLKILCNISAFFYFLITKLHHRKTCRGRNPLLYR